MPLAFTRHVRFAFPLLAASFILLAGTASAQEKFSKAQLEQLGQFERMVIYHPRPYKAAETAAFKARGGVRIDYTTADGAQAAWLVPPASGGAAERLWVICGGNATLALDLEPLCRSLKFDHDAFLLVDYPGFGQCAGAASPRGIRENVKQSVLAAAKLEQLDPAAHPETICVFGHSLGCAAALLAVEEFHLRSAVLCAPFTSTGEMAVAQFGLPKDFPLQNNFDNRAGLKELAKNKGRAWIFHGDRDNIIPVEMSKTLKEEFKDTVELKIVTGAQHNDVIRQAKDDFLAAMKEARK